MDLGWHLVLKGEKACINQQIKRSKLGQRLAKTLHFLLPHLMSFPEYVKHALQFSDRFMLICIQPADLQPARRILPHHQAGMASSPDKHVGSDGCYPRHDLRE